MIRKTFRYCATHKEDEQYMQQMCSQGWAAIRLVEGFWTFESCEKNQYCYRIGYLRGMKPEETEQWIEDMKKKGIEFVSRYSFWAIFRSTTPFVIYTPEEDLEICRKMAAPMIPGAVLSWILCLIMIILAVKVSGYFGILTGIIGIYAAMCSWLGFSYHQLLKKMRES